MRDSTLATIFILALIALSIGIICTGCMTSPKVEVRLENSRGNTIHISAPATGDPTKTVTTDAKAALK